MLRFFGKQCESATTQSGIQPLFPSGCVPGLHTRHPAVSACAEDGHRDGFNLSHEVIRNANIKSKGLRFTNRLIMRRLVLSDVPLLAERPVF